MPPKKKDDLKRVLMSVRIEEALTLTIKRVHVEEKGARSYQDIFEDALREYVGKHYAKYYKEYKKEK